MTKKATLTPVSAGHYAPVTFNDNFNSLNNKFDNTLSLDGSAPNALAADIDLNGNDLLNVKDITVSGTFTLNGSPVTQFIAVTEDEATVNDGFYGNTEITPNLTVGLWEIDGVAVTPTAAELNYLDGVTSNVQTQLDAKQDQSDILDNLAGLSYANKTIAMATIGGAFTLIDFLTETDLASNSLTAVPSQSAVKAYVDALPTPVFTESYTSSAQTITVAGALTLPHSLTAAPTLLQCRLKCTTAEGGYSIGDEVIINPAGNELSSTFNNMGVSVVVDATNVNIRFGSNGSVFQIVNKTTGNLFSITPASWEFYVYAWK